MKKKIILLCSIAICIALLANLAGCVHMPVQAKDLMEGVEPQNVETVPLTEDFSKSTADFSIKLLQQTYEEEKNTLVAPMSVLTALAIPLVRMTRNRIIALNLSELEKVPVKRNAPVNLATLFSAVAALYAIDMPTNT